MYTFDVISFFFICNDLSGNPGHLAKPLQLHHLQGKQKAKAFSSPKAKIKQTAQKQSFKSKLKANITKWVFISEKLKSFVYKPFVMFKEFICKRKVVLKPKSKIAATLANFRDAAHWVMGAAHPSGAAHWAALFSVKITQAQCIDVARRIGLHSLV